MPLTAKQLAKLKAEQKLRRQTGGSSLGRRMDTDIKVTKPRKKKAK